MALPTVASVAAATPHGFVRLTRSAVPWARPERLVGAVPPSQRVTFQMYLRLRDEPAAERLALAVSDPADPAYQRFLTPEAFRARFAPSETSVDTVESWLRSQGFSIGDVAENHTFVEAAGTAAQAERAFGVRLGKYRVNGSISRAPSAAPRIPAELAGVVSGVGGLDDTDLRSSATPAANPPSPFQTGTPCSRYWGQRRATTKPKAYGRVLPYAPCGYTPQQLRGAYGLSGTIEAGDDGRGTTIAILDAYHSPTAAKDLRIYSRRHGLPRPSYSELLQRCPCPGSRAAKQAWAQEQILDLEAAHAIAPRAHLLYVGARTAGDANFLRMTERVVDENLADVFSNSSTDVGEDINRSLVRAQHQVYVQAAAEGISVLNCTNDFGDGLVYFGQRSLNWPASDPLVTAVGGTSLAIGAGRAYLSETGWGTTTSTLVHHEWSPPAPGGFLYGSTGGTSGIFDEPAYQRGVVPRSLARRSGEASRVAPDVALDGDPNTGFVVGQTLTFPSGDVRYAEFRFGGTSLSTPLLAGITALAVERGGARLGLLNPALYGLAGSAAFRDVVDPARTVAVVRTNFVNSVDARSGRSFLLRTMNQTGTLHTAPGYDDVTGLGSPRGGRLIDALAG